MIYGSVCSGIEAASVAWHPLGMRPAWFSEIADFPSRVLRERWPEVPNRGDFTTIETGSIDVLVGGTPCQSFSVAGSRAGLDDPRGVLALEFLRLARRVGARWLVWENVPGALSSGGGGDIRDILGAFVDAGYGVAWRVLDAQWFGVPQRRRRFFAVGYLGDWRPPVAVLFERPNLRGNPAASGGARSKSPGGARERTQIVGGDGITGTLTAAYARGRASSDIPNSIVPDVANALTTRSTRYANEDTFVATPHAIAFHATQDPVSSSAVTPGLAAEHGRIGILTFDEVQITHPENRTHPIPDAAAPCLPATSSGRVTAISQAMRPRRLTPREWERLQGFPDDYTAIDRASDGARYAAIGNSMAVPVMRWIGQRMLTVDNLIAEFGGLK